MSAKTKTDEEHTRAVAEAQITDTLVKYLKWVLGIGGVAASGIVTAVVWIVSVNGHLVTLTTGQRTGDSVRSVMMTMIMTDTTRAAMQRDITLLNDQIRDLEAVLTPQQRDRLRVTPRR